MENIQKYSFKTFLNLGMPFIKAFLKKQQGLYINDLTKELEKVNE